MCYCQLLRLSSRSGIGRTLLLIGLLAAATVPALAQYSINTIPLWDGSRFISSFGVVNTATYGQRITVAAGATPLTSFSFEIGNCDANVTLRGEVYAWDGSKATGSALYESAPVTISNSSAYQLVTFTTGSLSLPAGQYILFASTSRDQTGAPSSACRWGTVPDTAYAGGEFHFLNNGPTPDSWTTSTWSTTNDDLAMQVTGLIAAPTVTGVDPPTGPAAGGTPITITGTGFTSATSVTINGTSVSFTVVNDTTITATTPPGSPGTAASVIVTNAVGSNAANTLFQYEVLVPTLSEWGMIGLAALLAFYAWRRLRRQDAERPA